MGFSGGCVRLDALQPAPEVPAVEADDSTPAAASLAQLLASVFGGTVLAILHYGSRAQGRTVRPDSPFDFFVVVTTYRDAYRAAAAVLGPSCRPRLAVMLARVLPPNAIAIRQRGPFGEREGKCMIISERDFRRECSPRARDYFVQVRMSQQVLPLWSRDAQSLEMVTRSIATAREGTFDWVRLFLPGRFDPAHYCQTMIDVSLAYEIRAEARGYGDVLFAAQRVSLLTIYAPVLRRLAERGNLIRQAEEYQQRRPPTLAQRIRTRSRLRWSKLRTTLRLFKHPFLYDDWLGYLTRKIDRSTGQRISLTERERRRPLLYLWPRVWHYLRHRPQRQS
jgi:hypothetical protein